MEIEIKDRLKAIVNKETAFLNAVKKLDYSKVKELLNSNPEFLLPKHVKLIDDLYKKNNNNLNTAESNKINGSLFLISKEVNYTAEKNYSNFYAYANKLEYDNQNLALRTELNTDPPCNKEPLIHYISKGADITMLTNDNLEKKLQDLAMYSLGGIKVLEQDKIQVIDFAVITAIKNDDIGAFKYLDNEFKVTEKYNLKIDNEQSNNLSNYANNNNAKSIFNYLSELKPNKILNNENKNEIVTENNNSYSSQIKLKTALETKKLIDGIENLNLVKIDQSIKNGANVNYSKIHESINKLDDESKQNVHMRVFQSIKERNENLPNELKYNFDFKETMKLQEAATKGNGIQAYNAIKNGADPKGITKGNYNHLDNDSKKLFENAIHKAYTDLTKKAEIEYTSKKDNNLKM